MMPSTYEERRRLERLEAAALADHQRSRLNQLLDTILPHNQFYADKLADLKRPLTSLEQLATLPFTTKDELQAASAAVTWPRI